MPTTNYMVVSRAPKNRRWLVEHGGVYESLSNKRKAMELGNSVKERSPSHKVELWKDVTTTHKIHKF